RVQLRDPGAPAERLHDLPESLIAHAALYQRAGATAATIADDKHRVGAPGIRPLSCDVVREGLTRDLRQGHGRLMAALAADATQPKIRGVVTNVEGNDLGAAESSIGHQADKGPLTHIAQP